MMCLFNLFLSKGYTAQEAFEKVRSKAVAIKHTEIQKALNHQRRINTNGGVVESWFEDDIMFIIPEIRSHYEKLGYQTYMKDETHWECPAYSQRVVIAWGDKINKYIQEKQGKKTGLSITH